MVSGVFSCPGAGRSTRPARAALRQEKKVVIRLVEELRSPDNPTEIAHGFPVPDGKINIPPLSNEVLNTHPEPRPRPAGFSSRQLSINKAQLFHEYHFFKETASIQIQFI